MDDITVRIGLLGAAVTLTPLWPEPHEECDGSHPARTTNNDVINLYDLVAHCQPWANTEETK